MVFGFAPVACIIDAWVMLLQDKPIFCFIATVASYCDSLRKTSVVCIRQVKSPLLVFSPANFMGNLHNTHD